MYWSECEPTLLQSGKYCEGAANTYTKSIAMTSIDTVFHCRLRVLNDWECTDTFYSRTGTCYCVKIGQQCHYKTNTRGNSVYNTKCAASTKII